MALDEAGRRDVRRDHALLDQPVGIVAGPGADGIDLAVRAENNERLGIVEIDSAAAFARAPQSAVQRVELVKMLENGGQTRAGGGVALHHCRGDIVVDEARTRAHDSLEESRPANVAVSIDIELACKTQTVFIRTQRAEIVGKLLRQHRHDALGKVNRRAAQAGLGIERRAGLDVGRHVGNRHGQLPPRGRARAMHRVVEVARIRAIDGDECQAAQILAPAPRLLGDVGRQRPCLLGDDRRPLKRKLVGPDGDVDLHSGRHVITHHLDDMPDGLAALGWLLDDLDDHHLAVMRLAGCGIGNEDVVKQAPIVRRDETHAAVAAITADDAMGVPFEHLDQRPLAAPLPVDVGDPRDGTIAVHERTHLAR